MSQRDFHHCALDDAVNLDEVAELERLREDYKQSADDVGQRVLRRQAYRGGHNSGTGEDGVAYLLHARNEREEGCYTYYIYRGDDDAAHEADLRLVEYHLALLVHGAVEQVFCDAC